MVSVRAIYHQGQLRLLDPVHLTEGQHVQLHIVEAETPLKTLLGDLLVSFEAEAESLDEAALALVKRYMPEVGTGWMRGVTAQSAGHDIVIAQITLVEMLSAIGRQYHDGAIGLSVFQAFKRLMLYHTQQQYQVLKK